MDDTGRIAMYEKRTSGTDGSPATLQRYIYSNHLSTASLELDEDADIISYEEYHPYGTTAYQAMNSTINAVAKRYRYTGKERDEETGLYYHGARYYMPWLVRWMAVDPLQYKNIFISSYVYCSGNPVSRVDDDGMDDKVKTEISTLKDTQVGRTVDDRQVLVEKGSTIMTSNAKEGGGDDTSIHSCNRTAGQIIFVE